MGNKREARSEKREEYIYSLFAIRYSLRQRGFSLIEVLIYVGLVAVLTISIIGTLITLAEVYGTLAGVKRLNTSGASALDRIIRTVRDAESVDIGVSQFSSSPGSLTLNMSEGSVSFLVENGVLEVEEDGASAGRLTQEGVSVSGLTFTRVASSRSEMVMAVLELTTTARGATSTKTFRGGAVVRGSY